MQHVGSFALRPAKSHPVPLSFNNETPQGGSRDIFIYEEQSKQGWWRKQAHVLTHQLLRRDEWDSVWELTLTWLGRVRGHSEFILWDKFQVFSLWFIVVIPQHKCRITLLIINKQHATLIYTHKQVAHKADRAFLKTGHTAHTLHTYKLAYCYLLKS